MRIGKDNFLKSIFKWYEILENMKIVLCLGFGVGGGGHKCLIDGGRENLWMRWGIVTIFLILWAYLNCCSDFKILILRKIYLFFEKIKCLTDL